MRTTNPCDGCALRRVRCGGGHPCAECRARSITCTFLRIHKKRGPKGPRLTTVRKIETFQKGLEDAKRHLHTTPARQPAQDLLPRPLDATPHRLHHLPLSAYLEFLEIFRCQLYSIWPIVSCEELISRLKADDHDFEAYALAGALCAAVIAQLRLPEHMETFLPVSSRHFEMESRRLRNLFNYRDQYSMASLLTSFFLHIYFANTNKLQTAGLYLRESISHAHGLALHLPGMYTSSTATSEHQLRLRVYWIMFISERTFCAQNGLPAMLQVIDEFPAPDLDANYDSSQLPAFLALTRLFMYLESQFIAPPSSPCSLIVSEDQKSKISTIQHNLQFKADKSNLDETQQVDIIVTRNWIRTLLWQYTIVNFPVSCHANDEAFSALLPALIAQEMLSLFSAVSNSAIRAHGYGMELKIFRMADSLLDVLLCAPSATDTHSMLVGSRDALIALENVLLIVGGPSSQFVESLRRRMAESDFAITSFRQLDLPILESVDDDQEPTLSELNDASDPTASVPNDSARVDGMYFPLESAHCDTLIALNRYQWMNTIDPD